jgi:CRP-like cAMP-binding protein
MADLHSAVLPKAASALQSLGEADIYRIPHAAILDLADRFPTLAQAFWRDCTVDGAVLAQWSLTNARQQGLGRIAHLFAELGTRFGVGGDRDNCHYEFPLTQIQLGDTTNLTAVHVNRMLRQLRDAGVITIAHKTARVHDWGQLCSIAEFDATYLHLHRGA